MPVVTCPKCPTRMKVPDGVSGNTKCPKCGTIFPVNKPAAPAFEVVDDAPAAPVAQGQAGARPVVKAVARVDAEASDEPDFEVVDEKPKKRVVASDDDDDDEPRAKKKSRRDDDDDDEDDDRPRRKKRRDDDDDDGPRARKKKKRRYDDDDEDEDDEWMPRKTVGKRSGFANAKTAAKLMSIAFWLNTGAYGVLTLLIFIGWVMSMVSSGGGGGSAANVLIVLPGLLGLGSWIVGIVGAAFGIAGPPRAKGMSVTATVLASVHLLLIGIVFFEAADGMSAARGLPVPKVEWLAMSSSVWGIDLLLPMLVYQSSAVGTKAFLLLFAAAVCEVLRLVFMLQALKEMATAARDRDVAERCGRGTVTTLAVVLGGALGLFLLVVLLDAIKSVTAARYLGPLALLLLFLSFAFMMVGPAVAAAQTKDACDN